MNEKQLIDLLRLQFGGLDFWRLSKKWKEIHYQETARMILQNTPYKVITSGTTNYMSDQDLEDMLKGATVIAPRFIYPDE